MGTYVFHIDRLWEVKEQLMQTSEEIMDWTSDTGKVFGKLYMGPYMFTYCAINMAISKLVFHRYRHVTKSMQVTLKQAK
jgi:hypothetical protein